MKSAKQSEAAPESLTAIAEYSPTAAALADLARRMAKVVYDVSTPEGLAAAKRDRAEVRDLRVALEHKRVEIKAPALKRCNEIDTEAKRITAELLKYETPPDEAIKAHERKIEEARLAKVKAEQERQAAIQKRIDDMRALPRRAVYCKSAAEIQDLIDIVDTTDVTEQWFAELKDVAADAKTQVFEELTKMHEAALARETESKRLADERAELDKQRAEQEARDKADREKREAETRAENERLRQQREAFEAEQAAAREAQRQENERIAAAQAAESERIRKEREALEAAQRAEREAENARIAVRLADEQRQLEEAEAKLRREREEEERQRKANFKPTTSEMLAVLADHYERDVDTVDGWLRAAYVSKKKAA